MVIVGDLKKIIENLPDDTPVVLHIESKDLAYDSYTAKYITNRKHGPYDGGYTIEHAIARKGGVLIISDWRF